METFWRKLEARISEQTTQDPYSECLIWKGSLDKQRKYGTVHYRDPVDYKWKHRKAHRVVLMLRDKTLQIPRDKDASHLCHNSSCVNVNHMNLEPRGVNNQRKSCDVEGICFGHGSYPKCKLNIYNLN